MFQPNSRVDNMASTAENTHELITCTSCEEPYDDDQHKAMALSCHHIFCSDCLKQCYRKRRQEKVSSITCPDCNHLTQVPNKWVAALPITISNGDKHGNNKVPYFVIIMFVALVSVLYMAFPHNFTVLDHKQSEHVKPGFQGETDAHCHTLDDQLQGCQSVVQEIGPEKQKLQNDKNSLTKSLVAFIQFAKRQLDQCEQQVTDVISQHHGAQDGKLLGKQLPVLNDRLHSIGQAYFKTILPSRVAFRNEEITAGLESVITLELYNDAGNTFLFVPSFLTVTITDPQQKELPITLYTTSPEGTVTFTPQVSGKHGISIMLLGQKLKSEQTHVIVNSNNPVLKFGEKGDGKGTFMSPWGIAMDNNGVLYVADQGNRLIQKFSSNGEFMSQFDINVHDKDGTTLNLALDQNNGLIFCAEIGYRNEKYCAKKNMLVFNLEGKLQRSHTLSNVAYPISIAINKEGNLVLSDITNNCLCEVDKDGKYLSSMGEL